MALDPSDLTDLPPDGHSNRWRIDKSVPLALIVALVFQGALLVFFLGSESAELREHERRIVSLEAQETARAEDIKEMASHLASLDTKITLWLEQTRALSGKTR